MVTVSGSKTACPPIEVSSQVSNLPPNSPKALALRLEVEDMISKGALERVADPDPGFYRKRLRGAYFQVPVHHSSGSGSVSSRKTRSSSSESSASDYRLLLRSSHGCSPQCRPGPTPVESASSGTWMTGWSWPLWRPRPDSMSRTSCHCATP